MYPDKGIEPSLFYADCFVSDSLNALFLLPSQRDDCVIVLVEIIEDKSSSGLCRSLLSIELYNCKEIQKVGNLTQQKVWVHDILDGVA